MAVLGRPVQRGVAERAARARIAQPACSRKRATSASRARPPRGAGRCSPRRAAGTASAAVRARGQRVERQRRSTGNVRLRTLRRDEAHAVAERARARGHARATVFSGGFSSAAASARCRLARSIYRAARRVVRCHGVAVGVPHLCTAAGGDGRHPRRASCPPRPRSRAARPPAVQPDARGRARARSRCCARRRTGTCRRSSAARCATTVPVVDLAALLANRRGRARAGAADAAAAAARARPRPSARRARSATRARDVGFFHLDGIEAPRPRARRGRRRGAAAELRRAAAREKLAGSMAAPSRRARRRRAAARAAAAAASRRRTRDRPSGRLSDGVHRGRRQPSPAPRAPRWAVNRVETRIPSNHARALRAPRAASATARSTARPRTTRCAARTRQACGPRSRRRQVGTNARRRPRSRACCARLARARSSCRPTTCAALAAPGPPWRLRSHATSAARAAPAREGRRRRGRRGGEGGRGEGGGGGRRRRRGRRRRGRRRGGAEAVFGFAPHVDLSLFTLLATDEAEPDAPGLALHADALGGWVRPRARARAAASSSTRARFCARSPTTRGARARALRRQPVGVARAAQPRALLQRRARARARRRADRRRARRGPRATGRRRDHRRGRRPRRPTAAPARAAAARARCDLPRAPTVARRP